MERWLGSSASDVPDPDVVLEDVYLNFPDRPRTFRGGHHLSELKFRDEMYQKLGRVKERRLFVTVGHRRTDDLRKLWRDNEKYLGNRSYSHVWVYKPVAGLHHILVKLPRSGSRSRQTSPPAEKSLPDHSAPGRLLMVASRLLARSSQILQSCRSVEDAVHAAMLALEAQELLGSRTPTTALEALALRHEAEVIAESLFIGVQYNLDLGQRFREVHEEVREASKWFRPAQRRRSALNAELTIIERLASRFRHLNQVEEELACLARARRLRFDFWVRERPWRWVLWPVLRYIAFALSSLGRFAVAVGLWILLFWPLHHLITGDTALGSLSSSAFFTFTLQLPSDFTTTTTENFLLAFQSAVSLINMGLLLSHLYIIVSRR
jgi:hypothetical protein